MPRDPLSVETFNTLVKKSTSGTIAAGTPVYVVGVSGDFITVEAADASDSAKMPAIGIVETNCTPLNYAKIVFSGLVYGIDTSSYSAGDALYVASGTGLTTTKPTGSNTVQRIGIVGHSSATKGSIVVASTGGIAEVPNTAEVAVLGASSVTALTDQATISVDASLGNLFTLTISGNRELALPTNASSGQTIQILITQGSGGSHTLSYASGWEFEGGTDPVLSLAESAVDILSAVTFDSGTSWQGILTKNWS